MSEQHVQLAVLLGGAILLGWAGIQTGRYHRFFLYLPIPLIWLVMLLWTTLTPHFWESDQAALPALVILGATAVYGIWAVKTARQSDK